MTPTQLLKAVARGRCVYNTTGREFGRHVPAAFVVSMQFRIVMRLLPTLRVYRPRKRV